MFSDVIAPAEPVRLVPLVTGFFSDISVENPVGSVVKSVSAAREELLLLLSPGAAPLTAHQHMRVEYLSKVLEKSNIPIQTIPFLNLAVQGSWRQVYSNVLLRNPSPLLECNITQTIEPADAASLSGRLLNTIFYAHDMSGGQVSTGKVEVQCEYTCNSKGEMHVKLLEHVMLPDNNVPEDIEAFLLDLQRSVPYDTFDPNDSTQKLLFVDPELKVVRVQSSQMVNVLNVYLRG
eukprot:gene40642-49551_t